ncbi:MAG: peptidoglycan DD-metalloendopeptidase family protein [Nitrospiria bacterium]
MRKIEGRRKRIVYSLMISLSSVIFFIVLQWIPDALPALLFKPFSISPIDETGSLQEEGPSPLQFQSDDLTILSTLSSRQATVVKGHTFKPGDSLFEVLSFLGVPDGEIFNISKASKAVYDLRKVIPGQSMKVFLQEVRGEVRKILYEIDPLHSLKIERTEGGFHVVEEKAVLEREVVSRWGTITDTLFQSAGRSGVPSEVILELTDIFAWDLDFSTEIQLKDRFRVVYEQFKKDGKVVHSGRVLAAEMVNRGKTYRGYHFSPDGGKGDYYDEAGHSLRKAFLKSPLRYRYISSGFNVRRKHPILKVNRPHLGIDFVAPYGTPVRASGSGVVSYVGWRGGHGKTVIIKHRNGYRTLYGHLSKYAKGIRKGKRVDQGDVIARVGSTGLSTGPHLHYTLYKKGKAINPRKADVLRGAPLAKKYHPLFLEQVNKMNQYLYPPSTPELLLPNQST